MSNHSHYRSCWSLSRGVLGNPKDSGCCFLIFISVKKFAWKIIFKKSSRMATVDQMCSMCNRDVKNLHFKCSMPECQWLCFHWWLSRAGLSWFLLNTQRSHIGVPLQLISASSAEPASTVQHCQGWEQWLCAPSNSRRISSAFQKSRKKYRISWKRAGDGALLEVCWKFACRWDWASTCLWSSPVKGAIMRDKSNGGFCPLYVD